MTRTFPTSTDKLNLQDTRSVESAPQVAADPNPVIINVPSLNNPNPSMILMRLPADKV